MSRNLFKMAPVVPSSIKNKIKREQVYANQKATKARLKLKARQATAKAELQDPAKKQDRLARNVPRTLENTREADESRELDGDTEVFADEASDEFSSYFTGESTPKLLITTSRSPASSTYTFAEDFASLFPESELIKRPYSYDIKRIVAESIERGFTDIAVIGQDKKQPNSLTLIHLPNGPTAYFALSSIHLSKTLHNHGRPTSHTPELILNHFSTRLGHSIGRFFAALFPQVPEFTGRQVVTFHNQRDFIFVRRHRYMFDDSGARAGLQELGPRFTLKLKWLQKGCFDTKHGDYEWVFEQKMEVSRRKFFL